MKKLNNHYTCAVEGKIHDRTQVFGKLRKNVDHFVQPCRQAAELANKKLIIDTLLKFKILALNFLSDEIVENKVYF